MLLSDTIELVEGDHLEQWNHLMGAGLVNGPAAGRLINGSVSENTRRVYLSQLRRLDAWLDGRPLNDATLAEYVGWLYESGGASATPTQAIAACRFEARVTGADDPCGALTKRVLAGFRRDANAQQRGRGQAFGISARQAARMAVLAAQDGNSIRGLRDAAIITVMSDAMLRVSEAAELRVEDVTGNEDGSGRLTIRQAKTDPNGEGRTLYLGPEALRRFLSWLDTAGIRQGRAFRQVRRGDHVQAGGLTPNTVRLIVKHWAAAVGIEGKRVSGQSLRVGMAQTLAAAGASVVEMQQVGRWKSPQMPAHYARGERAGRNAVARLVYGGAGLQGNKASESSVGVVHRALRLAGRFEAAGNTEGKQLAAALREWAVDQETGTNRRAARTADSRRLAGASGSGGQPGRGGCDVFGLLDRLSDVASAWRSEHEAGSLRKDSGKKDRPRGPIRRSGAVLCAVLC